MEYEIIEQPNAEGVIEKWLVVSETKKVIIKRVRVEDINKQKEEINTLLAEYEKLDK